MQCFCLSLAPPQADDVRYHSPGAHHPAVPTPRLSTPLDANASAICLIPGSPVPPYSGTTPCTLSTASLEELDTPRPPQFRALARPLAASASCSASGIRPLAPSASSRNYLVPVYRLFSGPHPRPRPPTPSHAHPKRARRPLSHTPVSIQPSTAIVTVTPTAATTTPDRTLPATAHRLAVGPRMRVIPPVRPCARRQ